MSKLDRIEKEIVYKKIFCNYTHQEIADELHMPIGTELWRYQKALDKIEFDILIEKNLT